MCSEESGASSRGSAFMIPCCNAITHSFAGEYRRAYKRTLKMCCLLVIFMIRKWNPICTYAAAEVPKFLKLHYHQSHQFFFR
ncbi:hypothetical protein R5R35_014319 [Gryllus longicercus]|uniref:Uncharacterized protein n=1 Tax=Gryllus longicercus TaxID=2509291 RepID=A0AAN9VEX5_9ORTH